MPPKSKKKPVANDDHRKITTYFKPIPKEATKRKLETNENSEVHEEGYKRTPSPPNTKSETKKPGLSLKSYKPVLRDINPAQLLNQETQTRPIRPTFAVLSDADIERGLEKASTPPISVYTDDTPPLSVYRDSQEDETRKEDDKDVLNTQFIPDSAESRWTTEETGSPVCVFEDDSFEVSASQIQEKVDYEKYGRRKTKIDENATDDKEQKEEDDDEEEEDSNFEDSGLFTKTADTTIQFRPAQVESDSDAENDLFFSSPFQSVAGGSTFFDDEKDGTYVDDFSIGTDYLSAEAEFSIGEEQPTLSPDAVECVNEVHVPYPNPRGKDILEKLDLTKSSSTEDDLPT
ncbi:hypothetical protein BD560DRAFT_414678 [Blakeslea trispora]|nr:hypothetical protein BD560DRAFT_414678 [Blakeslea trispora]